MMILASLPTIPYEARGAVWLPWGDQNLAWHLRLLVIWGGGPLLGPSLLTGLLQQ